MVKKWQKKLDMLPKKLSQPLEKVVEDVIF